MPNRILKESICTSDTIDELSTEAENFFYRLVVTADDFGRMDARPAILIGRCYPLRATRMRSEDVQEWLSELEAAELIEIYLVDGKPYLQIITWDRHQHRRAQHSKYPAPDDGVNASASICTQVQADESRFTRGVEESRNEESRNEESRSREPSSAPSAPESVPVPAKANPKNGKKPPGDDYSEDFLHFWTIYPRREEKRGAFKAWSARLRGGAKPDRIIVAARNYATATEGTETCYIKLPATFLGEKRPYEDWIDGIPPGRIKTKEGNNGRAGSKRDDIDYEAKYGSD